MKKWVISAFVITAIAGTVIVTAHEAVADRVKDLNLSISAGYRVDKLDWNIAGDISGNNPNIMSELTWEDLAIYQIKAKGELNVENEEFPYFTTYFRGAVGCGLIVNGENQDSDYNGDNRTQEYSRSNNSSDDGYVLDASLGAGFQFRAMSDKLAITPLGGYSYHAQHLTMTDGFQTIPFDGPFPGLDSTYETQWYGPWAGLDLALMPTEKLTLIGSFEYHWIDYYAKADWNLRIDFQHPKSFEHRSDGHGVVFSLGGDYAFTNHLSIYLNLDYQDWKAERGIDTTFMANGTVGETRLNEVNWISSAVMLGITYRFF